KQKKLIMLPSETMIWQPEFTDKTLSRKPGAVQLSLDASCPCGLLRLVLMAPPSAAEKSASLPLRISASSGTFSPLSEICTAGTAVEKDLFSLIAVP
uniref:hypothetical protein n=1 Tax=Shigella flexneri TaxID=623 RepID=UPI003F68BEEC